MIKITNFFTKINKKIIQRLNTPETIFKFIFLLILLFILFNISRYSYKAWLYPIRTSQYFDECSYISMGKFFRTISPISIYKDHIMKDMPLPKLYEEFICRLIYWPILLSFPLKYTEDRIELHKFRAILMTIGTIVFFLIGLKLSGIIGGIVAAAFWTGTPLLNYWGHFFMTENPSFIFFAAGLFFLLYSDRSTLASFVGGILLGISGLTRFTTMALTIVAPFIIIAVYFCPFKRKNFQILGELAKTFAGFCIAVLPYLFFTWWLYRNPFVPFLSAQSAVNLFPVNDSMYYFKNLWLETGIIMKIGVILGLFSPLFLSLSITLRKIIKESKLSNNGNDLNNKNLFQVLYNKIRPLSYLKIFGSGIIYYVLIFSSLVLAVSIYIFYITKIPHKLPRYLAGAIIPLIIIAAAGIGSIESLLINIFRLIGNAVLSNFKKYDKTFLLKKILIFWPWCIGFFGSILLIVFVTFQIWNHIMKRPFNSEYIVHEKETKELIKKDDIRSLQRLQPEYLAWQDSVNTRLKKITDRLENGIDDRDYHDSKYRLIIKYLNDISKADEVFYVDRFNQTPFTPAYAELPCIYIESLYNNTIDQLIKKGELLYKGYVLINNDANEDIYKENGEFYIRSLNKIQIESSDKFKFVKEFGKECLYYYAGKPFIYKFGTKERINKLYKNKIETTGEKIEKGKSIITEIVLTVNNLFRF